MKITHFDKNDPKYRCCCSALHIETVVLVFGIIQVPGVLLWFLSIAYVPPVVGVFFFIYSAGIVGSFLYAVKSENKYYLLPYLLSTIPSVIASFIAIFVPFIWLSISTDGVLIVLLASGAIGTLFVLDVWHIYIIMRYYKYLERKEVHSMFSEFTNSNYVEDL